MFLLSSKSLVIFSFPLNFFIPHVLNQHISCQSHLLDFWRHIFKDLVLISGVEQRNGNLAQINCFGGICGIGEVCNVLDSNQNLVFWKWNGRHPHGINNPCFLDLRREVTLWTVWNLFETKVEEILSRAVCSLLDKPLVLCCVVNCHIVRCGHSDRVAVLISLIKDLLNSFPIVRRDPSVLHELDSAWGKGRCTLWPIVHDCEGSVRVDILHGDSRVYRVVVVRDVQIHIIEVLLEVPSWSVVQNSLLHLKTVGVSEESLIVIEVSNLKLSDDLPSIKIDWRKRVEVYIKFYYLQISIDCDVHDTLLLTFLCSSVNLWEIEAHLVAWLSRMLKLTVFIRSELTNFLS